MSSAYLANPDASGHTYGQLIKREGYWEIHDAAPAVAEAAKRVLPGCKKSQRIISFRATRRLVGDLNWLMLRYPLVIESQDEWAIDIAEATGHAERRDANMNLKPATPPELFTGELRDYQASGVSFLTANKRSLLADDMGLGKTVSALASMSVVNQWPVLIVLPCNIQVQWQQQVGAFLGLDDPGSMFSEEDGSDVCEIVKGRTPYKLSNKPIIICHYGLLANWQETFNDHGFPVVIFDEIQELRRTESMKYSAASLISTDAEYVWGLSGTPIYNYGIEMWCVMNILDYHCLGDREAFTREWCSGYGTQTVVEPAALHDHLKREGLMLRRRKSEVETQLPPKRRIVQAIDHNDSIYKKLIKNAAAIAKRYDRIKVWSDKGKAAAEIDRETRLASGVAKAPHAAEFVKTLIDAGERPLIYAWHHAVHDVLSSEIKDAVMITGKQTGAVKRAAVQQFAEGKASAAILSLRATAGLDGLQGRATCVVFVELDWSPAVHTQCEDRVHRIGIGDVESLLCYYLYSQTGTDAVMMDALGLKVGQFNEIMGDKSETEEDRELATQAAENHMKKMIERLKSAA